MFPQIPEPPRAGCGDLGGRMHDTAAKSSHRGVEVHTGDAPTSSFKGLIGLQATWGDREKDK